MTDQADNAPITEDGAGNALPSADSALDPATGETPPEAGSSQAEGQGDQGRLSSAEAVAYLAYPEAYDAHQQQLAEQQAAIEQRARLESGDAVREIAAAETAYNSAIKQLVKDNPGMDSPEATAEMEGVFDATVEQFGLEVALSPPMLAQIYDSVGGQERFGPDPVADAWTQAVSRTNPFQSPPSDSAPENENPFKG